MQFVTLLVPTSPRFENDSKLSKMEYIQTCHNSLKDIMGYEADLHHHYSFLPVHRKMVCNICILRYYRKKPELNHNPAFLLLFQEN